MNETTMNEAEASTPKFAKTLFASKMLMGKSLAAIKSSSAFAWHAYLGAAMSAEESAVGFVKSMANKGAEVDSKARAGLSKKLESVTAKTKSKKAEFITLSKDKVVSLEKFIGAKFKRSLTVAGVPTASDIEQLNDVMTEMSKAIEELSSIAGGPAKTKRARAASG